MERSSISLLTTCLPTRRTFRNPLRTRTCGVKLHHHIFWIITLRCGPRNTIPCKRREEVGKNLSETRLWKNKDGASSRLLPGLLSLAKMTASWRWEVYVFMLAIATVFMINATEEDKLVCNAPLGMESGLIPDSSLSASSSYARSVGPEYGRIRVEKGGGAWCPRPAIQHNVKEWLEIVLNTEYRITAVETQGRFGNGQGQEFAEAFLLEYWRENLNRWVRYKDSRSEDVLRGNWNPWLAQTQTLELPFIAQRVRFIPYSQHPRTACMRVELYGCLYTDGVRSYAVSRGTSNGTGTPSVLLLEDVAYDGVMATSHAYQGGLGHLVDGRLLALAVLAHAQEENGANEASNAVGKPQLVNVQTQEPVWLVFEFVQPYVFTSVTFSLAARHIKPLPSVLQVVIEFSLDGEVYYPNALHYTSNDGSLNLTVPLRQRIGKFVRFQLRYSESLLLLTEVTFAANSVMLNESSYLSMQRFLVVDEETTPGTFSSTNAESESPDWTQPVAGAATAIVVMSIIVVAIITLRRRRRATNFPKVSPSSHMSSVAMCNTPDRDRSGRFLTPTGTYHSTSQSHSQELGLPESESESSSFLYHEPYPGCQLGPQLEDSDMEYGALLPRNSPRCHLVTTANQLSSDNIDSEAPAVVFTLTHGAYPKQPHIWRDRDKQRKENHYAATDILNLPEISGDLAMEITRPMAPNMVQLTAF